MSYDFEPSMVVKGLELLREKYRADPNYIHNVPRVDAQIEWFSKYESSATMAHHGGGHLGSIREWIQRKFRNGSDVTWGSTTPLVGYGFQLNAHTFEELASMVAAATLNDLKGR